MKSGLHSTPPVLMQEASRSRRELGLTEMAEPKSALSASAGLQKPAPLLQRCSELGAFASALQSLAFTAVGDGAEATRHSGFCFCDLVS